MLHDRRLLPTSILLAALFAAPALAQSDETKKDDAKARTKVGTEIQLKVGVVLKDAEFPVPSDSPMANGVIFEKSMRGTLSTKQAKKARKLYRWGRYLVSKKKPGTEIHISVLATTSPESAVEMCDLFLLREKPTNKKLVKDGIEVVSKKMTEVKPKAASKGYAYERTLQAKGRPPERLTKVVVSTGRYTVEVLLVGVEGTRLAKRVVTAVIKAVAED